MLSEVTRPNIQKRIKDLFQPKLIVLSFCAQEVWITWRPNRKVTRRYSPSFQVWSNTRDQVEVDQ